jgi:hypothetical protein
VLTLIDGFQTENAVGAPVLEDINTTALPGRHPIAICLAFACANSFMTRCTPSFLPWDLKIQSHGSTGTDSGEHPTQYCSVQEFSAPEGTAYIPYWMMQRLLIEEGAAVVVASIVDVPRGTYCRLQPESASFLSLAADIGPKVTSRLSRCDLSCRSVISDCVVVVEGLDGERASEVFGSLGGRYNPRRIRKRTLLSARR